MVNFSEWITRIAKAYVPGVVGFYEKLGPNNKWHLNEAQMHVAMEKYLETKDDEAFIQALNVYESQSLRLIAAYRSISEGDKVDTLADGFWDGLKN